MYSAAFKERFTDRVETIDDSLYSYYKNTRNYFYMTTNSWRKCWILFWEMGQVLRKHRGYWSSVLLKLFTNGNE